MNIETAKKVQYMIQKECQRNSLEDLCEYWEITTNDFYEFLECAMHYIDMAES